MSIKGEVERKMDSNDVILNLTDEEPEIVASQSTEQLRTKEQRGGVRSCKLASAPANEEC